MNQGCQMSNYPAWYMCWKRLFGWKLVSKKTPNVTKIAKFCPIWSHWRERRLLLSFLASISPQQTYNFVGCHDTQYNNIQYNDTKQYKENVALSITIEEAEYCADHRLRWVSFLLLCCVTLCWVVTPFVNLELIKNSPKMAVLNTFSVQFGCKKLIYIYINVSVCLCVLCRGAPYSASLLR